MTPVEVTVMYEIEGTDTMTVPSYPLIGCSVAVTGVRTVPVVVIVI
jgi:hypothetical protein